MYSAVQRTREKYSTIETGKTARRKKRLKNRPVIVYYYTYTYNICIV